MVDPLTLRLAIQSGRTIICCAQQQVGKSEQQELQRKFQEAQQEKNFAFQEKLQKEMAEIQYQNNLKIQKEQFAKQEAVWEKTMFYQNAWPLIDTPQGFISRLERNKYPLTIITAGALDDNYTGILMDISEFFNRHYASEPQIYFYNQGWKPNMKNQDGNAQRDAINDVLAGLPTLLLLPKINDGKFTFNISFWGFGDMGTPQTQKVAEESLQPLYCSILREKSLKWKNRVFPPNPVGKMKTIQENLRVALEEEKYRAQLKESGCSQEEIDEYVQEAYSSSYKMTGLESEVREEVNQRLCAPICMIGAMFSDMFNIPFGIVPKLPSLIEGFPKELQEDFRKQTLDFYRTTLESIDNLDYPMTSTLLAFAYKEIDDKETAREFLEAAVAKIGECYAEQNTPLFAEKHWDAICMIRKAQLLENTDSCRLIEAAEDPEVVLVRREEEKNHLEEAKKREAAEANLAAAKKYWEKKKYIKANAEIKKALQLFPKEAKYTEMKALLLKDMQAAAGQQAKKTVDGIDYVFRWCPPGTFMMGTPSSEAGWFDTADSHEVTLTEGFWLLETPITQAMWESIMGTNPCKFRENSNLPVESVNWIECKVFCSWISDRLRCKAFLPTEAQWEYACRAGTGGPYGGCGNLDNMGWYTNNSDNKTHEVGLKQPNAWGLRDMHGNVCEWCADWKEAYNTQIFTDPQGPSTGSSRVVRGGCWSSMPKYCRSSYRYSEVPDSRHDYVGFRFLLMDELFSDEETD